jgi:hypothetical protein
LRLDGVLPGVRMGVAIGAEGCGLVRWTATGRLGPGSKTMVPSKAGEEEVADRATMGLCARRLSAESVE